VLNECCGGFVVSSFANLTTGDGRLTTGIEPFGRLGPVSLLALPPFYTWPIDVLVWHGPWGDLVLRVVSRLDAFSGYPVRT
jgi:hypothetical protein